jgi:hypothetical protein
MTPETRKALISQLRDHLKVYTDNKVTVENAAQNYTRQFPHRCHMVIVALLEEFAAFKDYTHGRLDEAGVPKDFPGGKHSKDGCRIGDRLDWLVSRIKPTDLPFEGMGR